jgi:hypothetical protein
VTSSTRSINLPEALCAEAERQFGSRFQTVEELLTFVLQELTNADADRLDESEQKMLEHRLKELGYL